jgi:hypothetical protein
VVVSKLGTATTRDELMASFREESKVANELSAAVFIDRDGTIIEDADCSHPKQVKVFPAFPNITALKRRDSTHCYYEPKRHRSAFPLTNIAR